MTIDYHITIGTPLSEQQALTARNAILLTFDEVNALYNDWNPHSEVSRLNRWPAHTPFPMSERFSQFFQTIEPLVSATRGVVDPTILPLKKLWIQHLERGTTPSPNDLEALRPAIGWHTVRREGNLLYKSDDRTALDLGGVAKGWCIDLLVERLRKLGCRDLLVEWGGEMRAAGHHPSGRAWRVYVRHPHSSDVKNALAVIELQDQALATSGDYYQCWEVPSQDGTIARYYHIFDPNTLKPLLAQTHSVHTATLSTPTCVEADLLVKGSFFCSSPPEEEEWLQHLNQCTKVLFYRSFR